MTRKICLRKNTSVSISAHAFPRGRRSLPKLAGALAAGLLLLTIGGCGFTQFFTLNTTYSSFTGNWELQFTPTSGGTELTTLGGYIDDVGGSQEWATAAMQGTLSDCLAGQTFVPWYGNINGTSMQLYSYLLTGDMLTITATSNSAFTQFTGTYTLGGPCSDGGTGNVVGMRYASLTGVYSGPMNSSAGQTLQLNLSQDQIATGNGTFFITGNAQLQGFSCFTSANIVPYGGTIVGSNVQLQFTTNESPSSTLTLSGSINPTADTFTVASIQVSGGQCSGSLGGATLTRQTQ